MSESYRKSLIEDVYETIEALHRRAMPDKEKVIAGLHLSRRQAQTLWYLYHHEQVTIGQIAQWHQISKSLATQLIDSLVERDLLTREGVPTDRRVVTIRLAAGGKRLLKEFRALLLTNMAQQLASLTDEELTFMVSIGKKLTNLK